LNPVNGRVSVDDDDVKLMFAPVRHDIVLIVVVALTLMVWVIVPAAPALKHVTVADGVHAATVDVVE
jgi:hypothetical protein